MRGFRVCTILVLARLFLPAQDLKEFEKKVTGFTLANGMHFLVLERHEAPVISFHTYVRAGSVDDPAGKTGVAHLFEHMAYKGSETIGTKDWAGEKKALDAVEAAYDQLDAERAKGAQADEVQVTRNEMVLRQTIDRAQAYVQPYEYLRILEDNGATGLNVASSADTTEYRYSFPSNRLELWFFMESQRLLHPVFREFYLERDVISDEFRNRTELNPQGKLMRNFLMEVFSVHPYRNPNTGWPDQVKTLRRGALKSFYETYFVPANITLVMAGDVNPAEARRLAEHYFGPMPAKPMPPPVRIEEPPQTAPKSLAVAAVGPPQMAVGYRRPALLDPDDTVFDAIQLILSGRTGWLNRKLVEEQRLSLTAQAVPSYPGARYGHAFFLFLAPAQTHTVEENLRALSVVLARLETSDVDEATLQRIKAQSHALVLRRLADNASAAELLAALEGNYGTWKKMFSLTSDMDRVTAEDIARVAHKYFTESNRTVAYIGQPIPGLLTPRGVAQ